MGPIQIEKNCQRIKQNTDISINDFKIVPNILVNNEYTVYMYMGNYYILIGNYYEMCNEKYHFSNIDTTIIQFPDVIICSDKKNRNVYISLNGCRLLSTQKKTYLNAYNIFNNALNFPNTISTPETEISASNKNENIENSNSMVSIISDILSTNFITIKEEIIHQVTLKIVKAYEENSNKKDDKINLDEVKDLISKLYFLLVAPQTDILQTDTTDIAVVNVNDNESFIKDEDTNDIQQNNIETPVAPLISFDNMFDGIFTLNEQNDEQVDIKPQQPLIVTQSINIDITTQNLKEIADTLLKMYSNKMNIDCKELRTKTYNLFGYFMHQGNLFQAKCDYQDNTGKQLQTIDYYCIINIIADYVLMLLGEERNGKNIYTDDYKGKTITNPDLYRECTRYALKNVLKINITDEVYDEIIKHIKLKSSDYSQV